MHQPSLYSQTETINVIVNMGYGLALAVHVLCLTTWITSLHTANGQDYICCLKNVNSRIRLRNIVNYTYQPEGHCLIASVKFLTKQNKTVCWDPQKPFAQQAMKTVQDRLAALEKEVTSPKDIGQTTAQLSSSNSTQIQRKKREVDNGGANGQGTHCCIKNHNTIIQLGKIKSYINQSKGDCPIDSIKFFTKENRTICWDLQKPYAQKVIKRLDRQAALEKEVTSTHATPKDIGQTTAQLSSSDSTQIQTKKHEVDNGGANGQETHTTPKDTGQTTAQLSSSDSTQIQTKKHEVDNGGANGQETHTTPKDTGQTTAQLSSSDSTQIQTKRREVDNGGANGQETHATPKDIGQTTAQLSSSDSTQIQTKKREEDNGGANGQETHCCIKNFNTRIRLGNIKNYRIQVKGDCPIDSIKFLTKQNKTICWDPLEPFVQKAIKRLEQDKLAAQKKEVTSTHSTHKLRKRLKRGGERRRHNRRKMQNERLNQQ
ncbi:uncharacterized protein [Eucyclogobius newberryi]|uniref:uncharacterized protein n=1 Tax=Eucyclogobius newberryi TaxID=166745 RepID=UPI003B59E054